MCHQFSSIRREERTKNCKYKMMSRQFGCTILQQRQKRDIVLKFDLCIVDTYVCNISYGFVKSLKISDFATIFSKKTISQFLDIKNKEVGKFETVVLQNLLLHVFLSLSFALYSKTRFILRISLCLALLARNCHVVRSQNRYNSIIFRPIEFSFSQNK